MPTLTPQSEDSKTATQITDDTRSLSTLADDVQEITELVEDTAVIRLGFFPGLALYEAPYPYPGSTSYPGDSIVLSGVLRTLTSLAEGARTLTPLSEN